MPPCSQPPSWRARMPRSPSGWMPTGRNRPAPSPSTPSTPLLPPPRPDARMTFPLPPNATIGIVGGGELGRMSAMAAARLGYRCHVLTPEEDSPAAQVSAGVTIGVYEDTATLRVFADAVDVITFEFENVSAEGLDLLASLKPVRPSPDILRVSQDRVPEKSFVNEAGIPTAPWLPVESEAELAEAVRRLGLPAVLKTTRLGYDGKGQIIVRSPEELAVAYEQL